jgi:Protein of unknown function (DUF2868)
MTLADLVDLEAQLLRDRDADPAALEARDRALLTGRGAARPRGPHAMLSGWLDALRAAEPRRTFPGEAVARALRAVRLALVLAGFALGWGAAAALLRFDGPHPVNVWEYLLAFVGVQLLLLVVLVVAFAAPRATAGIPLVGAFRALVGAIVPRVAARAFRGDRGADRRVLLHRLRSRRSLYRRVEPWLLLGLTQRFAVAFNVGVLLATLRMVVFTDVAFAWATTLLELSPARFHGIVEALAAPWARLWPDAAPSAALVEATRYSRLERAYFQSGSGRAADPALVGAWWPFLVAAVACYGLFPRVFALAAAGARTRRVLARLPFDDVEVRGVLDRLAAPRVETRSPVPEAAGPGPIPAPGLEPRAAPPGSRCALVLWRDVPLAPDLREAITRRAGCEVSAVHLAGGRDHEEGAAAWDRIAAGADPVVVLAEAWEAPDKGALRLLRALRAALGPRRRVLVLLTRTGGEGVAGPEAREVALWREGLARLEDPWLAVEGIGTGPGAGAAEERA